MGRPSNASKLAKALMEDANKTTDQETVKQVKGNSSKKRAMPVIRKSGRIHKKVTQSTSKMVEKNVIEEIKISDSDKEDGHTNNIEGKSGLPDLQKTVDGRSLEEKVEYLLQAVDQLLKKPKIDSLKEENNQLCKKLDIAVGKLEAYGEGNRVLIDTLKEVILSPNGSMSTKTAPPLPLPAAEDAKMAGVVESPTNVAKKRGRKKKVLIIG